MFKSELRQRIQKINQHSEIKAKIQFSERMNKHKKY